MKLLKYDKTRDAQGNLIISNSNSSDNNSNTGDTTTRGTSPDLDRKIWGQYDEGDDIDGHMTVNGDVHIKVIVPPTYEPDEDDDPLYGDEDGDDIESDEGGGNLFVELGIKAGKEIEGQSIYAKEFLYVPHPSTKVKTDIMELFKDWDDRITANKTEIDNLKSRVTTIEGDVTNIKNDIKNIKGDITTINTTLSTLNTNITNLTTTVNNLSTTVNDHSTRITNIENTITGGGDLITEDKVKELIENAIEKVQDGDSEHPVILFTGTVENTWLRIDGKNQSKQGFILDDGMLHKKAYITSSYYNGWTVNEGLMIVPIGGRGTKYKVHVSGAHATQFVSGETRSWTKSDVNKTGNNDGSHWFEVRYENNVSTTEFPASNAVLYIREFHQSNGDKDSWSSNDWGQYYNQPVYKINLTIYGWIETLS